MNAQSLDGARSVTKAWRAHRKLLGKFHPDYPDDIQVIVHDGGPRLTDRRPELVWARVVACGESSFKAIVLNRPQQLVTVAEGAEIRFVVPGGSEHPLAVSERYLAERSDWLIHPCSTCGITELLDAPSDLIRVVFPSVPPDSVVDSFTAICGICGGAQVVERKDAAAETPVRSARRWWRFWE